MAKQDADFDAFVIARGPTLLRFGYVLTADAHLAQDLVQEALIKAHRRWLHAAADHPEAYVRRIMVNQLLSWRRRRSSGEIAGALPDLPAPDAIATLGERELVWGVLSALPRRQRAVLVLRYYEDLADAEIATLLGCAEGTVRSLASRAFATLRSHPTFTSVADQIVQREETA